jgi:hypothetical protein
MLPTPVSSANEEPIRTTLSAWDFGIAADGKTDDGGAIQQMIARAKELGVPVELRFPEKRVICLTSGVDRYVFPLSDLDGLRINGQGSEFRLAPHLRFLRAERCSDLAITDLSVDFLQQPTTPGTITTVDPVAKTIDVELDHPSMAAKLGGPTDQDGEQAFFGMILLNAIHKTTKVYHFYVDSVTVLSPSVVRITNSRTNWKELKKHVKPGQTRIGLPVPGIAHRYGPGPLFAVDACRDVTVSYVEVWSAPWFTFRLARNEGVVSFRHVNVRPKPGSAKVLSSCRDAIHAKGNRAELLFEDCVLDGLGDDAFNISTHCSRIRAVESPTDIMVSQQFPLGHIPFRKGDAVVFMDPENNRKVAERIVMSVREIPSERESRKAPLQPWAPSSKLTLDRPIDKVAKKGLVVWSRESSNPKSVIRRCVIRRSCRLQTPVVMEECDVQSLLWFYGAEIEGPGPESVIIRNSRVKANGLPSNLAQAIVISGWQGSRRRTQPTNTDAVLQRVRLIDNEIWGSIRISNSLEVELADNRITIPGKTPVEFHHCSNVVEK